ncbi:hypothetical protein NP493_2214g00000 [Ridgeia piscesae]|uniref:Uncharacterized protein n=1 Tax=Ridgeia piscesae TaxID=27915 RepID=A0AAD9JK93_RIDPI|nr:hypothetical protein NP493_2214g00000 [Ridgeia piscesae]
MINVLRALQLVPQLVWRARKDTTLIQRHALTVLLSVLPAVVRVQTIVRPAKQDTTYMEQRALHVLVHVPLHNVLMDVLPAVQIVYAQPA